MGSFIRSLALVIIGMSAASATASAQEWRPDKPVRLVVPFAPGGATDVVARIIGNNLSPILGQPVVIENRPGAGATVATNAVKDAPPDGHTLLMATIGFGANPALFREKLPYDVLKDFTHITKLVIVPVILVAHPSIGVKTPAEFLAKAKAQPGTLTFGSQDLEQSIIWRARCSKQSQAST